MDIKVDIDSDDVMEAVKTAILDSVIGAQMKKRVEEEVRRAFTNGLYTSDIVRNMVQTIVADVVRELVLEKKDDIRAEVRKQMEDATLVKITSSAIDAWLEKVAR